jgi:hypothetical protein
MNHGKQSAKKSEPKMFDVVTPYTDGLGRKWTVSIELKAIGGRAEIAALMIESVQVSAPVTQRLLRELPIDKLFHDFLVVENKQLSKVIRGRKETTAHQGRRHSISELEDVTRIYLQAHQARLPVQQTVADTLGISVSTAAKRIMAARRNGLIPPVQDAER